MSLKNKVVLVLVICLSYKVVMTGCKVVLVSRNVIDSFRVGLDGCTNNASVCPSSATCQSDGSCLCSSKGPTYRNPVIKIDTDIKYGDSYGCVDNFLIRLGVGNSSDNYCPFGPSLLIPYSHKDPATKFSDERQYEVQNCTVTKALVKFPDNFTEIELQWLSESYVNLTISNKTLLFKWKRSVPDLQGTIITFNLTCRAIYIDYIRTCLRAKILGTWSADTNATDQSPSVITDPSTKPTTSDISPDTGITMATSSARSSPPGKISSNDGDSSATIVAIAVVVPIVLWIVLVVVVCLVCKHRRGHSQRNSSGGSFGKKKDTSSMKQFRHTDSNLRGPDAYADVPAKDTTQTFGSHLNPATSDDQSVIVEANPVYEAPDIKRKEIIDANSYPDPEYETPDIKRKEINGVNSYPDPAYETPDLKRREINGTNSYPDPGYETPNVKRKDAIETNSDSAYSTLDVKKREGNPAYSTPDVKERDVNPAYSTPDSDIRKEEDNAGLSTPDIKRIDINGDIYALPDKNRNSQK